ncbi:MAG: glycosyltransferase [Ignavibacteriaceae bacterium]
MIKKIALVTTGHPPLDERIFWKFALSISSNGYETAIFCSTENISTPKDNILLKGFKDDSLSRKEKLNKLYCLIRDFEPALIICSEVSAIIPAYKYKKSVNNKCKIISDITEWYPENVAFKHHGIKKWFSYFVMYLFNIYTTNLADALILGENNKVKRYNSISPLKHKVIIAYYPVLRKFKYSAPIFDKKNFYLNFSGKLSTERGFYRFINIVNYIAKRHKDILFTIVLSGKDLLPENELAIRNSFMNKNISLEIIHFSSYDKISEGLRDVHICFDLRDLNFIYDSIPIKFFEYLACGKPVIYSNIKAITETFDQINFGFLVNPDNFNEIVNKIETYLSNSKLLLEHSENGRALIENGKNWEAESQKLITLIKNLT